MAGIEASMSGSILSPKAGTLIVLIFTDEDIEAQRGECLAEGRTLKACS